MYSIADQLSNLGQYQKALETFQEVLGKRSIIDRYSKLNVVVEVKKQKGGRKAEKIREKKVTRKREEGQEKGWWGYFF
jgi:hypothetical protein